MSIAYDDMKARLSFGLPDRLSKALDVADITSNDMADYLGVSRTTISNYINGRTPAKMQTLRLWAMKTGVPLKWLETGTFGDDENPRPVGPDGEDVRPLGFEPRTHWIRDNVVPVDFTARRAA